MSPVGPHLFLHAQIPYIHYVKAVIFGLIIRVIYTYISCLKCRVESETTAFARLIKKKENGALKNYDGRGNNTSHLHPEY